jgi:hypothetical protein
MNEMLPFVERCFKHRHKKTFIERVLTFGLIIEKNLLSVKFCQNYMIQNIATCFC